jgi:isopenicillin N synthase-like dioxygenase
MYSLELKKLSVTIIEFMTKALKIQTSEILDFFEDGVQSMRMNYHPPCPQPEQVIELNPHSDVAALTILLQVNEMDGLQIRKDGMWIPIKPLSEAFVINIGDMFEVTNPNQDCNFHVLFRQKSLYCQQITTNHLVILKAVNIKVKRF